MKHRTKPTGRVFVIHDVAKGPSLEPVQRVVVQVNDPSLPKDRIVPARLPMHYGYSNRKVGSPKAGAVFDNARVFGIQTRI